MLSSCQEVAMLARIAGQRLNLSSLRRSVAPMTNCPTCGPAFLSRLQGDSALLAAWGVLPRRRAAPGSVLQAPGQPLRAVWFVEQGLLRSYFSGADGRERNRAFHPEAQWAGTPPPHGPTAPATFAVEALEPSSLVELSYEALSDCLRQWPALRHGLTDALAANLDAMTQRESSLLMDSAEQRYRRFLAEQPELAKRVPLNQVASYLGITDVALSRIRRRMKTPV